MDCSLQNLYFRNVVSDGNPILATTKYLGLLFENHLELHFSLVITVACSRETQIQRVVARGVEAQVAELILAAQASTLEKITRANFVIWNDGCLEALESQADELVKPGRLDLHPVAPPRL